MKHAFSHKFIRQYEALSRSLQAKVDKQAAFLVENLHHPSLRAKKYDEALAGAPSRGSAIYRPRQSGSGPAPIGLLRGRPLNLYTLGGGDPPVHAEGLRYFGGPSAFPGLVGVPEGREGAGGHTKPVGPAGSGKPR